jgi:dihydroneopterin aldolase
MKIFFAFALILITHFSYAQSKVDTQKIYESVKGLNEGSIYEVYKYDESSNALHYQMYFPDEESFITYTHFKSVESIFDDAIKKIGISDDLDKVISLGVDKLKILIKSENNGDVFVSRVLSLIEFQAKVETKLNRS